MLTCVSLYLLQVFGIESVELLPLSMQRPLRKLNVSAFHLCVCACVRVRVCLCARVCVCVRLSLCLSVSLSLCLSVSLSLSLCLSVSLSVCR